MLAIPFARTSASPDSLIAEAIPRDIAIIMSARQSMAFFASGILVEYKKESHLD
jgi:hypothetical protein